MKIALIKPPLESNEVQPPLGLGYLVSSVKSLAEVEIIDAVKDNQGIREVFNRLKNKEFDIIGLQCFTVSFNTVKILTKLFKKNKPNTIVILGGPHPTLDPVGTLQNIDADYAFLGDSEIGFSKFIKLLKKSKNKKLKKSDLKKIPGFAYRIGKKIQLNKIERPENLDDYDPCWHLYGMKNYPLAPHGAFCKQSPTAPITITRGCPFNCTYCGGPKISGHKIRSHSVDYIIKQIEILVKKYGIREIHIEDDNFTMNREFVQEFCNKLIEKNLGITWACPNGVRADTLDEPLLRLMKKSGCYLVSLGIESGSNRIRKLMRKNLDTKTIEEKVKLLDKCGINVLGSFILGYPGDTVRDINKTINFACELPLKKATFTAFKPFPGTDAYNQLVEQGELGEIDYSRFSLDRVVWTPRGISKKQLKNLRRKALIKFYFRLPIIFKMLTEIKNLQHLKFVILRIYRWLK